VAVKRQAGTTNRDRSSDTWKLVANLGRSPIAARQVKPVGQPRFDIERRHAAKN
jgi:hypothetical protein